MTIAARHWLIKFAATVAVIWACCWATPRLVTNLPQFRPVTTVQENEQIFDRYFKLPTPEVAIAGSSLAYHLKEPFFERGNVRNVALPGGSPLTALAIIAAAPPPRPKVIAVETNILDRTIDQTLFAKFREVHRPLPPLPLMRTIAAWYEGARSGELTFSKAKIDSILASPPAPDRSSVLVATIWDDWSKPGRRDMMPMEAKRFKSLAEQLEAEGVRVFFFEMPYPSRLNHSVYANESREIFSEVIPPDDVRRLSLDYPADEMRSVADGVHLDDRSSLVFAIALGNAIEEKLNAH